MILTPCYSGCYGRWFMKKADGSLTDAQLRAELERCEYCEEKPCQEACPPHCSPADFIMAARVGEKSDLRVRRR